MSLPYGNNGYIDNNDKDNYNYNNNSDEIENN